MFSMTLSNVLLPRVATTTSIQTSNETNFHELPNNDNNHDKSSNVKFPSTTKDGTPPTTSMTTTTSLLWILLLITPLTWAAVAAIQWPVIKRGSTFCLLDKTVNVSPGGQQFTTDKQVRTWDVWLREELGKKQLTKTIMHYGINEIKGVEEDRLL